MVNPSFNRKRVFALRRASDGSAFEKCNVCGVSVAVALYDMHKCKKLKAVEKRLEYKNQTLKNPSFHEQPRSPFSIFMEDFKKQRKYEDHIIVDRKGFEIWKSMSKEERKYFVDQAEKVNSAYDQTLMLEQVKDDNPEEDDEADSINVGKFAPKYYEEYDDWEDSESFEIPHFERFFG